MAENATGIVRRIDDLGRIVIPKEIRRRLMIREGDPLELIPISDGILVKPYTVLGNSPMAMTQVETTLKVLTESGVCSIASYDTRYLLGKRGCVLFPQVLPDVIDARANDSKVLTFFDEEGCPIRWAIAIRSALGDKVGYLCGSDREAGDKHSGLIVFAAKMIGRMIDDT